MSNQNERDARDRALIAAAARSGAVLTELAPGRSCGTCILCCKIYAIRELNKPAGRWCVHAERGCGCKIYEDRPDTCRGFYCMWRVDPKGWARKFCPENKKVLIVDVRGFMTVILPDREVPIGAILTDTEIVIFRDGDTFQVGLQPREAVAEPANAPSLTKDSANMVPRSPT